MPVDVVSATAPDCVLEVRSTTDAVVAGYVARAFASAHQFPRRAATEMAIVAAELSANIVRHGGSHGLLCLAVRSRNGIAGIEIVAEDDGPGLNRRSPGGRSPRGGYGLGQGIPAVRRLVDEFEAVNRIDHGLRVRAFKRRPGEVRG